MYYVRFWKVSAPVGRGFVTTPLTRGDAPAGGGTGEGMLMYDVLCTMYDFGKLVRPLGADLSPPRLRGGTLLRGEAARI